MRRLISILFLLFSTAVYTAGPYTPEKIPDKNFLLVAVNQTNYFLCTQAGCGQFKIPGHMITQNFTGQYTVHSGYGQTIADSPESYLWNVKEKNLKKLQTPSGIKKWLEYSYNSSYVLNDETVIGEYMYSSKRNDVYIKQKGRKTRLLGQFRRFKGSHDFMYLPDGRFIFRDAPGTMKQPTAPFSNYVKGYPQTIYYGNSLSAKPKKVITRPAFMSLAWFNNGRHLSYWVLGKYRRKEYRNLILEVTDLKTKKSKQLHTYRDELGQKYANYDTPIVYNSENSPYLIYEAQPFTSDDSDTLNAERFWYIHNIETGKKEKLKLPEGFKLVSTMNRVRIMNDQYLHSDHIVLAKRAEKNNLIVRVVTIPDLKPVFQVKTDIAASYTDINDASLFQNLFKAEYIVHSSDPSELNVITENVPDDRPETIENPFTGTWECGEYGQLQMTYSTESAGFKGSYPGGSLTAAYYEGRQDLIMGEWKQAESGGYVGFYTMENGQKLSGFWNYYSDSEWRDDPWDCTRIR